MKITIKELRELITEAAGEAPDETLGLAQKVGQIMSARTRMFEQAVQHLVDQQNNPVESTKVVQTLLRLVKGMKATLDGVEPYLEQRLKSPPRQKSAFNQPVAGQQPKPGAFQQGVK